MNITSPVELSTEEVENKAAPVVQLYGNSQVTNNQTNYDVQASSNLIDSMIDEISEYNRRMGESTIEDIAENMVNEVRHPGQETVKAEAVGESAPIASFEEEISDEKFSSTVSMEIAKIMEEVADYEAKQANETPRPAAEPVKPQPVVEPKPVVEQPKPVVEPQPVAEPKPAPEKHPVKVKYEEQEEEVVEIRNLKELEAEPVRESRDTMSNTIPFVVTNSDDEELLEDDEDDEGSNTILNIILIVLIVVLVAVLGLIVFYILRTRGVF